MIGCWKDGGEHKNAPHFVAAGADCLDETRGLGISTIAFKVTPQDGSGLLILENRQLCLVGTTQNQSKAARSVAEGLLAFIVVHAK